MADTKISLLPTATTPLAGTELIPVVQAGATRKVPASQFATAAQGALAATAVQPGDLGAYLSEVEAAALYQAIGSAQPTLLPVRNTSGGSLAAGTVVRITGSTGTRPAVAAADASEEATAAQTLGLLTTTLSNNSDGLAITHGILSGLNTAALTEGAAVWLSETTGGFTSTRPTQPAHGVFLGFCVKTGAGTAGILYVNVINGQELNELHDVLISNATTGQVLALAADGLWKNTSLPAGGTVSSVALGVPTGFSVTGSPVTTSGTLQLGFASGYSLPTTIKQGQWDTAYTQSTSTAAALSAHESASDPHPGYLTPAEGNAAYAPLASVHDPVTLGASVSGVLDLTGQVLGADDPGADRILFWDDSAGTLTHLATDSALLIDGTTLRALSTLVIPLTGEASNLTFATLLTVPYWPEARVLTVIPVWMANTAPTGSVAQFDIRVGGVSIFATLPTVDPTETSTATAATPAVFSSAFIAGGYTIAAGSSVSFHCTQIGATVAGAGLKVALPSRRAS